MSPGRACTIINIITVIIDFILRGRLFLSSRFLLPVVSRRCGHSLSGDRSRGRKAETSLPSSQRPSIDLLCFHPVAIRPSTGVRESSQGHVELASELQHTVLQDRRVRGHVLVHERVTHTQRANEGLLAHRAYVMTTMMGMMALIISNSNSCSPFPPSPPPFPRLHQISLAGEESQDQRVFYRFVPYHIDQRRHAAVHLLWYSLCSML